MFDTLALLSHDFGMAAAYVAAVTALFAAAAAAVLDNIKHDDGLCG
jgi:hypothetical protein